MVINPNLDTKNVEIWSFYKYVFMLSSSKFHLITLLTCLVIKNYCFEGIRKLY